MSRLGFGLSSVPGPFLVSADTWSSVWCTSAMASRHFRLAAVVRSRSTASARSRAWCAPPSASWAEARPVPHRSASTAAAAKRFHPIVRSPADPARVTA